MGKLPDNIKDGLEAELAGLQARLAAEGDDIAPERKEMLDRRVAEVSEALGVKKAAAKSKRPASGGAEKRPG